MEAQERNFAWVARHSSLSPATVARLLRAERAMNVEQFVDMAVALNLDPSAAINQAIGRSTRRAAQSGESVGRAMRARQDDDAETP